MRRRAPKFARKVDIGQQEAADALRAAGWRVEIIGRPVDLLLAKRGFTMLMELKSTPRGRKRSDQPEQQEFMRTWSGVACYADSPAEAVAVAEAELEAMRRGAVEARRAHNPEVAGSTPAAATK